MREGQGKSPEDTCPLREHWSVHKALLSVDPSTYNY